MRGRPPDIKRPVTLHTTIPEDLYGVMTLHLYSELEKKVPKGAIREFLCGLIRGHFEPKEKMIPATPLALLFIKMDELARQPPASPHLDRFQDLLDEFRRILQQ